ncbi:MAG: hypothetical protein ACRC56_05545, partial [Bosea sp. (in: a-proteobacteria)]
GSSKSSMVQAMAPVLAGVEFETISPHQLQTTPDKSTLPKLEMGVPLKSGRPRSVQRAVMVAFG